MEPFAVGGRLLCLHILRRHHLLENASCDAMHPGQVYLLSTVIREPGLTQRELAGRMGVTAFAAYKAASSIADFFLMACFATSAASLVLLCPCFEIGRMFRTPTLARILFRLASGRRQFARAARFLYGKKLPEKEWMPLRRAFNRPKVQEKLRYLLAKDPQRQPAALFVPQMILWCGRDGILGGQIPDSLKKLLPDGEFHTLPTAGHVPMYTHAGAVRDYVRGWLASNGS